MPPPVKLVLPVALVLALLAGACGGGSSSETEPVVAATPEVTDEPRTAATPDTPSADGTTPAPAESPTPDPTNGHLVSVPTALREPPTPAAAENAEEHLVAMFVAVLHVLEDTDRVADAATTGALQYWMPEAAPDLVIDLFATDFALAADVLAVIEGYAAVGASANYGPEWDEYWPVRKTAARNLRDTNALGFNALTAARDLDLEGRTCVALVLEGGPGECDDDEIDDLLEPMFSVSLGDLDLPDDAAEEFREDPLCDAWDAALARAGIDDATAHLIDLGLDDSLADTRFLGRSECRYGAGLGEDVEPDLTPGVNALADLYRSVVDVLIDNANLLDTEPEDSGTGYDIDRFELDAQVLSVAAESAASLYLHVPESVARIQLLMLADGGATYAAFRKSLIDLDRRVLAMGGEVADCWFQASFDDPECAPEVEAFTMEQRAIFASVPRPFYSELLDWDDLDDVYDDARCDTWTEIILELDEDGVATIDELLGLDVLRGHLDVYSCGNL